MNRKKIIKAKIISNKKIAPDHYVMEIASPHLARNSSPGQFVIVKVQEKTYDPLLGIPLGVHAIRKNGVKLLYKVVGRATEILSLKQKSEKVDVRGPLGNGFDPMRFKEKGSRAIMVAGGVGIAPLYALAEFIAKKKEKVDFFIGASTKKYIVRTNQLKKLKAKIYIATEDGTRGYKGLVMALLEKHLKQTTNDKRQTTIYACGPRPMLRALSKCAKKFHIPAQISLDAYMACGIGACLGCAIRTKNGYQLVCKDGPVFDAEEVVWDKL